MKTLLLSIEHIFVFLYSLLRRLAFKKDRPATILTYVSYSNGVKTRVLGRVVERISHSEFSREQRHLMHFVKVVKLFLTRKIANATLELNSKSSSPINFSSMMKVFSPRSLS